MSCFVLSGHQILPGTMHTLTWKADEMNDRDTEEEEDVEGEDDSDDDEDEEDEDEDEVGSHGNLLQMISRIIAAWISCVGTNYHYNCKPRPSMDLFPNLCHIFRRWKISLNNLVN